MSLVIDLSPEEEGALAARAHARGVSPERYARHLLRRNLLLGGRLLPGPEGKERQRAAERLSRHIGDMAGKIAPDTSSEEMDAAIDEALTRAGTRREWAP